MKQLQQEGWIHHLTKYFVASFFTNKVLKQDWTFGRDIFAKYLLDYDPNINNFCWKLFSNSSGFCKKKLSLYSPISFLKKYDPKGAFVKHFVPKLKNFPSKFIYEPWKAPIRVQKKAGCIIGKDYPFPIVKPRKLLKTYNTDGICRIKKRFSSYLKKNKLLHQNSLTRKGSIKNLINIQNSILEGKKFFNKKLLKVKSQKKKELNFKFQRIQI